MARKPQAPSSGNRPLRHAVCGRALVFVGSVAGLPVSLQPFTRKAADFTDAELHFKEALSQNPALYEPYFNLSILAITAGRKDEAQKYYRDYLRKGGPASAVQEERLRMP